MKRIHISCPYCGAQAVLRPATVVHGKAPPNEKVYVCARFPACDAYVSAHRESQMPMGTLANKRLREYRQQAHLALNKLWETGLMTRKEAYRWLQLQLGLPEPEAHIAHFSEYRCQQVITLCTGFSSACKRTT